MTRRGTASTPRRSTGTPASIWRRAAPASCGFWPSRCWMRRTSARVRSRWSRSSRSGSVSQPMTRPAVDLGDLAQLVRAGRRPQLARQLRADAGRCPEIGIRSAALSASRPPIPWPTTTVVGPSRSSAATTSSVYVSNESVGRVGGLRPVVVAQVEGVALPAARRRSSRGSAPRATSRPARRGRTAAACAASGARAATTRCRGRARGARSRPCGRGGR